jgi:hypothetical protein
MSPSHLCPCPACNRHVKTDAGVCPFCEAALPASFCATPPSDTARPRLSRAARLLAGATLVGASACSSVEPTPVPLYGGPIPADAGSGGATGSDAATGDGGATTSDAAPDRRVVPLYGAPAIPVDGGG